MSPEDLRILTGRDIPDVNLPGQPTVEGSGGEPLPIRRNAKDAMPWE